MEEGRTFGAAAARMMSGAWPPPAPSVWYVWMVLPPMAASVSSTHPAFVQSIGVDGNLNIELIGNVEAVVNDRRRCAPVLVDFQAHRTGFDLLNQRSLVGAVALAEKTKVHRIFLCGFQHHAQIPRSRGTRRCVRAVRRPVPPPIIVVTPL